MGCACEEAEWAFAWLTSKGNLRHRSLGLHLIVRKPRLVAPLDRRQALSVAGFVQGDKGPSQIIPPSHRHRIATVDRAAACARNTASNIASGFSFMCVYFRQ